MNRQGINTKAWYCSKIPATGELDREFGVQLAWDIPLLEGYEYHFFKNYSWKPSHTNGFFGLINLGMILRLFQIPKSVIVVHGYHYLTHLLILIFGRLRGHTVCLRMEMPLVQEQFKTGWKTALRRAALKRIVFVPVDYFLYIGSQNRSFYKSYGIPDEKLLFCPYSVDNERFTGEREQLKSNVQSIKHNLGIPADHRVILFSGKYIKKKNPLDVLKAYKRIDLENCWLIMLGEGELRPEMESFIADDKLQQVILTGFVNQSKISEFYAIADVFVMASTVGETWGLTVNEALNFDLPVIVSDLTGCAQDLVENGVTGYVYQCGNIDELACRLKEILVDDTIIDYSSMHKIISRYSYKSVTETLKTLVA